MSLTAKLRGAVADTRPLQDPHFRRLWIAGIITMIGAQLTVVAVPAQIYADTGSSAYVGLTGVFGLVPLIVFGLYGGALADHFDRRTILMVSTTGLIITSSLFWLQSALGNSNVWVLLCLFAVQQAFFAVNQPTRSALLPKILPTHLLPAANSLQMTVFQAGAIAGPLIAGVMLPFTGFTWLYAIDSVTLFATLYAVVLLPRIPVEGAGAKVPGLRSVWDGFAYLRHQPVLLMSFVVDLIAMVFAMPRALFPQIAHESFGGPSEGGIAFALLFAAIPAGAVVGGIFSGWVSRIEAQGRVVIWCIAVWALGITLFGLTVTFADHFTALMLGLGVLFMMVAGAADVASAAIRMSMLQSAADDNVRGRLQGVFTVVVAGGPRVADVLHGGAAAVVGTAIATTGGGLLNLLGIAVCALLVPSFLAYRVNRTPAAEGELPK
ncbi:MFS family permease [Nocardioides luteus]|uniref:MFS transporter n=1 Tax=Nocardioides luteus TaxID=1844 RepID=A0ABQ5SQP8_9ACTN|nr:MFS transporter [Nocardioides luteus]MDR7313184.1 MFS family permease [Nocardioides luteus]GGR43497.1 MFS transporter [Nocardioides luteus]GLJ66249.1 MFS transporter [Nocardioides luteus]